jgi:hypothetical protein
LYGSETWSVTLREGKIEGFEKNIWREEAAIGWRK